MTQYLQVDEDGELESSLYTASKLDPVQHASDLDLAANNMLPVDVVRRNRDEVSRRDRLADIDTMDIAENSPKTADFLRNPDNAAVAQHSIPSLRGLEDVIARNDTWIVSNTAKRAGNRAVQLTGNFLQLVGHASDSFEKTMTDLTGVNPGIEFSEDGMSFTSKLDPERQDDQLYGKMLSEYKPFDYVEKFSFQKMEDDPTISNIAGFMVEQGLGSIPDMFAAIYTLPAYLASRTEEIGETRMVNMGIPENPTWGELGKSFIPALAVAISERFAGKITLGKGGVTGLKSGAKAMGGAAGVEAGTEFVQEGIEYLGETLGTKKNIDSGEMIRRSIGGAIAGAGMGGGIRGTTATFEAIAYRNGKQVSQVMTSLGEQDSLDRIVEYAQSENLDEVGPTQHKEFLQSIGDKTEIILDGEAAVDLTTEHEYFRNADGSDIHIPLDVFVSEIANDVELLAKIRPHLKTTLGGMTSSQMESGTSEHTSAIRTLLKSAEKDQAIKTEADEIYEQVKDQIIATHRQGGATARLSAQLIPSYVTAYVARAKARGHEVSVKEAYAKMNLTVKGTQEPAAVSDILNQAVSDGYQGSDDNQGREWTGAVNKGMLMDEESRQIRAEEMGVEFDPNSAHDPDFRTENAFDSVQNFDDIMISESIIIEETGEMVQVERSAQDVWNETQGRKSELQQLLSCVRR